MRPDAQSRGGARARRIAARWLAGLGILSACGVAGCGAASRPDVIVLIVVDTLRRDALAVYGGQTPTPRIDRLAAEGSAHPRLSASFHQTSMSMAALFTGLTPSLDGRSPARTVGWTGQTWCGLSRMAEHPDAPCIPQNVSTLGEKLKRAGYWTAAVVSNQLLFRPAGFDRGFDEWVEVRTPPPATRADGRVRLRRGGPRADEVQAMVDQVLETRPDGPLFLYVHYMDVHDYMATGVPYEQTVSRVDRAIGELLDSLEARGLLADAAVVLTSDHGETLADPNWYAHLPGHRGNPSPEEQLAVPLVIWPAEAAPPTATLRSQDLHGVLLGLAGVQANPDAVLATDELYLSELHWQTYREGRFKSHRRRDSGQLVLIDLESDPEEMVDVSAEHPAIAARHAARMDELARTLGTERIPSAELSDRDRRALRELGYLE